MLIKWLKSNYALLEQEKILFTLINGIYQFYLCLAQHYAAYSNFDKI